MTRVPWARAASYGVIWGFAVTALESFELPLGSLGAAEVLLFHGKLLPHLCMAGIVLAAVTMGSIRRPWDWPMTAWAMVLFPLLTCTINFVLGRTVGFRSMWVTDGGESYLHTFWTSLFYGPLFMIAYRLNVRSEHARVRLAQTEIARQQAESVLTASRFQALKGHVDPAFLLRVIETVQTRYSEGPIAADQLLDKLVGFLRAAMAGIRSGSSSLAAEVELATQYNHVLRELDRSEPVLRVRFEGEGPDLPFPSLLMLPVIDALSRASGRSGIDLVVRHAAGRCNLSLFAPGTPESWLSPNLAYRMKVGLRALFGDDWSLALPTRAEGPVFDLKLPVGRCEPHSSLDQLEVSYG